VEQLNTESKEREEKRTLRCSSSMGRKTEGVVRRNPSKVY
jgi:hypothetical protein